MVEESNMHSFMSDISIIVRLMRLSSERNMSHHGLGFPEQMILMILSDGEPSSQGALANILGIDKGAIARTVAKLEKKGYVIRTVNPDDHRENVVEITPLCTEIIQEMRENLIEIRNVAFTGFTEEEQHVIKENMHRLALNLKSIHES